jgi:hypothetical protein
MIRYSTLFQLSATSAFEDWMYDANLCDILSNGKVIAHDENHDIKLHLDDTEYICVDPEDIINLESINIIEAYGNFLKKNGLISEDIVSAYFVWNISANIY